MAMKQEPPETHESLAKRLEAGGLHFEQIDTTLHEIRDLLKPLPEMQGNVVVTAPPEVQDDTHRYEDGEFVLI